MSVGIVNEVRPASWSEQAARQSKRPLEPIERISEVLFGLIMVLSITCSFSIAKAGREQVRTMLISALGCNLAWGIIDGCMYLMACFSARAEGLRSFRQARNASNSITARAIVADTLPPLIASVVSDEELDSLRSRLLRLPEPDRPFLVKKDWLGALAVLMLVLLSTLPVVIPFIFVLDPIRALRISNLIALITLFLAGYALGQSAGHCPWKMGLVTVVLGTILVVITIALGG